MRQFAVLCLVVVAGCRSGRVSQLTNDVELSQLVPCGPAFVGFESTCALTVTNRARRAVSVRFGSVSAFELTASVEVAAGQSSTVDVRFRPEAVGEVSQFLMASVDGQDVEVLLTGEGVAVPSCRSADECHEQTFDPSRGCVETVRSDGAACGQSNACLVNATCQAGECVGAPLACDDGSACTTDACDPSRGCQHAAVACAPSTNPCLASACDAQLGCVATPVVDGTTCGANDCQTAHVCLAGQCVERVAPAGSVCAAATACRGEGRCTAEGTCGLPPTGAPSEAFRYELPTGQSVQQTLVSTTGETFFVHGPQSSSAMPSAVLVSLDRLGRLRFEVDLSADAPGPQWSRKLMLDAANHRLFLSVGVWLQARDSRTGALLWNRDLRTLNIPITNSDTGALHLSVQAIGLVGTDDVLAQLTEGASLHQQHLVTFDGASGVERSRTPRPGHGVFLISGAGQTWGSWAACWSQDYRLARVDGAGRIAGEVARGYPIAMMGDSAILPSADGGVVRLSADLRAEQPFVFPAGQTVDNWRVVGAQGDEVTAFTYGSAGWKLVRSSSAGVRWAANVAPSSSWRRLDLVADGGVALSTGFADGGSSLSLVSNDGVETERCSMNGRTLSGIADELIIATEPGRLVGLRFPGVGAATSGWPDEDGIEGTRRWR
ncbi:MAG: hypothetical protein Q8N26_06275 [Myxococcales bacterium]|nr:hypothetical protein [Myxococcales bacterium]